MLAVGSTEPSNLQTELLSRSNIWSTQAKYPFGKKYISDYSIVAIKDLVYIFGGQTAWDSSGITKNIASFSTKTKDWKKCGQLKKDRYGHGVFVHEGDFIIIGGRNGNRPNDPLSTERCILKEDTIHCTVVKPKLWDYGYYPEMIAVPHDYCPK